MAKPNLTHKDPIMLLVQRLGHESDMQGMGHEVDDELTAKRLDYQADQAVDALETLICATAPTTFDGMLALAITARGLLDWDELINHDNDELVPIYDLAHMEHQGKLLNMALTSLITALTQHGACADIGLRRYLSDYEAKKLGLTLRDAAA